MKNYLSILLAVVLLVLLLSTSVSYSLWQKEKAERERLSLNLEQYGLEISELTLTNGEIKTELEKKNAAAVKTDSILKSKNRKISQLESLVATSISIRDTDTVYVPVETVLVDTLPKLYKSTFENTKGCIAIAGFILSTDSVPSLAITKRDADIQVYDIRIKRKWWQIFRPKEERFIESNCGEVDIQTIYKKK